VFILPAGQYRTGIKSTLWTIRRIGINFTRWTIFSDFFLILPAGIRAFRIGIHFPLCTFFPNNTDLCMMDDISKLS
jgi:hypothetical protein